MFLSFNNGKKIDLSMLKEGIDVQNDNFFKSYDKNNNSKNGKGGLTLDMRFY